MQTKYNVISVKKLSNPMTRGGIGSSASSSKGAMKVQKIGKIKVQIKEVLPKPSLGSKKVQPGQA